MGFALWLTQKISELFGDPFMFFVNISANDTVAVTLIVLFLPSKIDKSV